MNQPVADHVRTRPPLALLSLGFRPFYLLASAFAALSMALWVAQYAGWLPFTYLRGSAWHGSEMLFGYATAVVAGFLFTAVRNWTGKPTPSGAALAGCALLWLAGRVLAVTPYADAAAVVNAAFPLAVAAGIAIPLARARNRRNYFFVALLAGLALAALGAHLGGFDTLAWPQRATLQVGLDIVLFIMAVMGGRVIPMFTNNAIPGTQARRAPALERAALGGVLLLTLADLAQAPPVVLVPLALAVAMANAVRLWLWQPWRTVHTPLVWILHAAYAWIVVHLLLRSLAALDLVPVPLATHALTVGAIGGLTIGMMTRTARGHTGRPLRAERADVTCYALVMLAAVVRVAGPIAMPDAYRATVVVAGACWAIAFALYAFAYAPSLLGPRSDDKPA